MISICKLFQIQINACHTCKSKGSTTNDLGRGGENREKKNSKALLQEKKNFKKPSWKKIKFQKASPAKKN